MYFLKFLGEIKYIEPFIFVFFFIREKLTIALFLFFLKSFIAFIILLFFLKGDVGCNSNKPSGLVVHPGSGHLTGTLLNGLLHHFQQLSHTDSARPGIIHRLDKDTSGVMLIAKSDKIHELVSAQFKQRIVRKEYLALVWGNMDKKGKIQGNIERHPQNRQLFTMVENGGRDSLTDYELVESLPPLSWMKLCPRTGRTHQLRVHLKSIGHPIFCDDAYGGGAKNAKSFHVKYTQIINRLIKTINRVALHAQLLEITHPGTDEKIAFEAPLPQDLEYGLNILKNEQV